MSKNDFNKCVNYFQNDRSQPSFIPGNNVSVGQSKLCQRQYRTVFASLRTKFPESNSCATGLMSPFVIFDDDHTRFCAWSRRTRFRFSTLKIPDEFESGLSRLATQTQVLWGMFLYHIPTYHSPGFGFSVKNPSSKISPGETRVWLLVID